MRAAQRWEPPALNSKVELMTSEERVKLTITVSPEALSWAIQHINAFIASRPVNTEALAHAFVTALANGVEQDMN